LLMSEKAKTRPYEHIIFPLDVPSLADAIKFIDILHDHVGLFKVGLELFVKEGPSVLQAIAKATSTKIFLDMKFHDIPETVSAAQKAARFHGAQFITVHCDEGTGLLKAVVESVKNGTKVLGVTVLTSLSAKDLAEIGISEELQDPLKLVLHRAMLAKKANCAGVICSGNEVAAVKKELGKDFIVIAPGIRPSWGDVPNDDQKRISTPYDAIKSGADYIVVGRPIKYAKNPLDAAKRIADEVERALNELD